MKTTVLLLIAAQALTFAVLYLTFKKTLADSAYPHYVYVPTGSTRESELRRAQVNLWHRMAVLDGQLYQSIVCSGYNFESKENIAFFPLFPACVYLLSSLVGSPLACGVVLNSVLSVLGLLILALLIRRVLERPPIPILLLVLAFPAACFRSLFYTEALFLFLSVSSIYALMQKKVVTSSLLAALCGLTRPQGVLLCVPLSMEVIRHEARVAGWLKRPRTYVRLLLSFSPIVGMGLYATYVALHTGSIFSIFQIQHVWNRVYGVKAIFRLFSTESLSSWPDLLAATFGIVLIPFLFRRLPSSIAVYGMALALFPLTTGSFLSYLRFISVSFPHFIVLSQLLEKRPVLWAAAFSLFLGFQVVLIHDFMLWGGIP